MTMVPEPVFFKKQGLPAAFPDIPLLERDTLFREMMSAGINKFIGWPGFR
jgi:hypothetical protein